MKIKAIGFDQGGILIDVDYDRTVQAFKNLGATNADQTYTQAEQTAYIDEFEQGKITASTFRRLLKGDLKGLKEFVTDNEIDDAWNAMLLDFKSDRLEFIGKLRKMGYLTFIFSNVDAIHYRGVIKAVHRDKVVELFDSVFDEKYFSYTFGHNKPYANSFRILAAELKEKYDINSEEILFIDDSAKHIYGRKGHGEEGALCAGWQGLLVPANLTVAELRNGIMGKA